jgi:NTE family protein
MFFIEEKYSESTNMTCKNSSTRVAYIFQGGGALGAYQVGVFEALAHGGYEPDLIGGSSIGAINASIIVGNKPEDRVSKLREFWELISRDNILPPIITNKLIENDGFRRYYNFMSAQMTAMMGQDGFFSPNVGNSWLAHGTTPDKVSFYSLDPLQTTLERLIDFDLINSGKIRMLLQAVEVSCGKPTFFDNTKIKIEPKHIMASGALPPGFPAIEIDGKYYWDGGVISNMPLEHLMDSPNVGNIICFSANLFDSYGLVPQNLDDILKRNKDITFSSRYRTTIRQLRNISKLRHAIRQLYKKIPDEMKNDPEVMEIKKMGRIRTTNFVRFLYTAHQSELSSKDYEFSKLSIEERTRQGYEHAQMALEKEPWLEPIPPEIGVAIHEFSSHPKRQH